ARVARAPRPRLAFKDVLAQKAVTTPQVRPPIHQVPVAQVSPGELASRVQRAQAQMEEVLRQAQAGRSFSPAELLCLQVRISDASQVIDFTGKAVDKALGAVKQVLQTQV
ncbi:MAG: hypothetical protein RL653_925, partial [Pseudomonadota bacterium]